MLLLTAAEFGWRTKFGEFCQFTEEGNWWCNCKLKKVQHVSLHKCIIFKVELSPFMCKKFWHFCKVKLVIWNRNLPFSAQTIPVIAVSLPWSEWWSLPDHLLLAARWMITRSTYLVVPGWPTPEGRWSALRKSTIRAEEARIQTDWP
jgi:hypothetical protein